MPNVIKLNFDAYQEDWNIFANNVIDVVYVDALHAERPVGKDIRSILTKIRCCVHSVFFHDFNRECEKGSRWGRWKLGQKHAYYDRGAVLLHRAL